MRLRNKSAGMTAAALVMVLCLFAAPAVAQIDAAALDSVEAAAAAGNAEALQSAAHDAALNAVKNGMTIQEACEQIVYAALKAASASETDLESAVQAAVNGVYAAANELGMKGMEPVISEYAGYGIERAAEETGLDAQTVASLKKELSLKKESSVFSELKIPEAPMLETPDIRDRSSGSPI